MVVRRRVVNALILAAKQKRLMRLAAEQIYEKENGAVFSHMAVMYANALYKQGFIKEGYKVLKTLLETAMDFDRSRMYPGVPEYFDNDGRGLYSYLTGAASWYISTV